MVTSNVAITTAFLNDSQQFSGSHYFVANAGKQKTLFIQSFKLKLNIKKGLK